MFWKFIVLFFPRFGIFDFWRNCFYFIAELVVEELVQKYLSDDFVFISLKEAFLARFREHGFVVRTIEDFNEHSKYMDEVLRKLSILKQKNSALLRKYNYDPKYTRLHKRIREENEKRIANGKTPIISTADESILAILTNIKDNIDQKVYDRNDILKKDAYFEKTIMSELSQILESNQLINTRDDRVFIQMRLASQYLQQYNETYVSWGDCLWLILNNTQLTW